MSDRGPRIGLVLGGGGIAGYAFHCGVLQALQDATGFDPRTAEVIVGTSAGAIASAVLRGDVPATEMTRRLTAGAVNREEMPMLELLAGTTPKAVPRLWTGPGAPTMAVRELRRGRTLRASKVLAALLPQGRSQLTPLGDPLDRLHPSGWPRRPLWIPATDLRSGRLTVFGRGDEPSQATVAEAVEASAALPVYFAPVEIGGRRYIDGGLGSPFNAELLVGYGPPTSPLDLVLVLAPLSVDQLNRLSPISSVARSFPRRRLGRELDRLAAEQITAISVQPSRSVARAMGLNPMDPNRIPDIVGRCDRLVERTLAAVPHVVEVLERAGRDLTPPPDAAYPEG